jgi:hypothetical protein
LNCCVASLVLPGRSDATLMVAAGTLAIVPLELDAALDPDPLPAADLAGAAEEPALDEAAEEAAEDTAGEAAELDALPAELALPEELELLDELLDDEPELLELALPVDELQPDTANPSARAPARTAANRECR